MVCTKIKGEPIYEVVRNVSAHEELCVFYLLERIEDEILTRIQNTIYRQTMDSILEGQSVQSDSAAVEWSGIISTHSELYLLDDHSIKLRAVNGGAEHAECSLRPRSEAEEMEWEIK